MFPPSQKGGIFFILYVLRSPAFLKEFCNFLITAFAFSENLS